MCTLNVMSNLLCSLGSRQLSMLLLLIVTCLWATLTAHQLPQAYVGQRDGLLEFIMPHAFGIQEVYFNYMLNDPSSNAIPYTGKAIKGADGFWYLRDKGMKLKPGDQIQYSVMVWATDGKKQGPVSRWAFEPATAIGPRRTRAVIFRDDFNGRNGRLDLNDWELEVSMFGGRNWEFQVYTNQKENVFLRDGILYLKPTLTVDDPKFDENFLNHGTMDVAKIWGVCTNSDDYGCSREGQYGMLPPVMSGKVSSIPAVKCGCVEVRAKPPKGDWLWPAIWMMPRDDVYGGWPLSGEIDLMETRGNAQARSSDGQNHGINELSSTLHWGPAWNQNHYAQTHGEKRKQSGDWHDFHTWKLCKDANQVLSTIDGDEILRVPAPEGGFYRLGSLTGDNPWAKGTKIAPFDEYFYLILNVAVGGTNGYFPDNYEYGVQKPWPNSSPHANADFWGKRGDWQPTWRGDDVALQVDYVEFTDC